MSRGKQRSGASGAGLTQRVKAIVSGRSAVEVAEGLVGGEEEALAGAVHLHAGRGDACLLRAAAARKTEQGARRASGGWGWGWAAHLGANGSANLALALGARAHGAAGSDGGLHTKRFRWLMTQGWSRHVPAGARSRARSNWCRSVCAQC